MSRLAKDPPPATRAELDETIAEIRQKKRDGWLLNTLWDVVPTGTGWRCEKYHFVFDGQAYTGEIYRPRTGHDVFAGQSEAYHIAVATMRNRRALGNAIKVISARATGVRVT